jgi:hypothetical protein
MNPRDDAGGVRPPIILVNWLTAPANPIAMLGEIQEVAFDR